MLAVVKTHHIEINIKGSIPEKIISILKDEYGKKLKVVNDENDELIDVFKTEWYKSIKSKMTPQKNLKFYRKLHNFTQEELGQKIGNVPKQHVSNMEQGFRPISLNMARKLAKIFDVSVEIFI